MIRWFSRGVAWAFLVILSVTLAGCSTLDGGGALSELHLFGVPVALNLGSKGGPDGIGVRLYASGPGEPLGLPIRRGSLEVLMFDGVVGEALAKSQPPLKTWSFTPDVLRAYAGKSSLGVGYQLALRWGREIPRQHVITVIAHYRGPKGVELWSTANTVSVVVK